MMVSVRCCSAVLVIFLTCAGAGAQNARQRWIDSVFQKLSEDEKIGQLMMVPVSSGWDRSKLNDVGRAIKTQGVGALLFSGGEARRQMSLTREFRAESSVPLLVAMNAGTGPGALPDSALVFPNTLSLGALSSDSAVFYVGKEIGRQLKLLGVNMNLAPTANLSDNLGVVEPRNTFGSSADHVALRSRMLMAGLHSQGILSCTGFLPIRGLTVTEVQNGLPTVRMFVDSLQVFPFRQLFDHGVAAAMPAARELPLFYETRNSAKKNKFSNSLLLSASFAGDWMKKEGRFTGLVIVDIRPIENTVKSLRNGEAEVFALQAGNEMVITDYPEATARRLRRVLRREKKFRPVFDAAVKKVLGAKYDAGLHMPAAVSDQNFYLKLRNTEARLLQKKIFRESIVLSRNDGNLVPVRSLENRKILTVVVGDTTNTGLFADYVSRYVSTAKLFVRETDDLSRLKPSINANDLIIAAFTSRASREIVDSVATTLGSLQGKEVVIADIASAPLAKHYGLFPSIITVFSDHPNSVREIPQAIFGATQLSGILPVPRGTLPPGWGISTRGLQRLAYSFPEDAGMSSQVLRKIDAIAGEAIASGATPGCQVLVARHGKVVFQKSYGHFTYEKQTPVTDSTIYDLASVTKVAATLQAVMFLYDRGMIDINKKASAYLPELRNSNKRDMTLKDVLTHQAGLWPFLPFWANTVKDTTYLPAYYSRQPSAAYPYVVADNLYASAGIRDTLWNWVIKAKVREKPARTPFDYRYSDMGFYVLHHLSEKILNQPMDDFLYQNLYEPLGAGTTTYLPLLRFRVNRIAPTANDRIFRKSLLIGTVHDEGAALHGGVAGHAGLFSTANDLAKLGQMLLQDGYYGGYQYFKPETVRAFAEKQFASSPRGLGWNKPVQSEWNSPTSILASPRTFGHTGFTGTCIWMDPEFDLLYIFLSNRVHPEPTNNKLLSLNIRTRIQDVIYQAIFENCSQETAAPLQMADF